MDEVSEEDISKAERASDRGHGHEGVAGEDGTLRAHLLRDHGLDVPEGVSPATQSGLHDRLHEETAAADE